MYTKICKLWVIFRSSLLGDSYEYLPLNLEEISKIGLVVRKPVFGVSDQVRHKPVCRTREDGYRLEITDLGRRGIVLSE